MADYNYNVGEEISCSASESEDMMAGSLAKLKSGDDECLFEDDAESCDDEGDEVVDVACVEPQVAPQQEELSDYGRVSECQSCKVPKAKCKCGAEATASIGAAIGSKTAAPAAKAVASPAAAAASAASFAQKHALKEHAKKKRMEQLRQKALNDAEKKYNEKKVTNVYYVSKEFTLAGLAAQTETPVWSVDPKAAHMFKRKKQEAGLKQGPDVERLGDASKSVIERVRVLRICNDAPTEIGVTIPFVSQDMYDAEGNEYTLILGDGESTRCEKELYSNDKIMANKYMREYGHVSAESLKSTFKATFDNKTNVKIDSPIINVMRYTPEMNDVLRDGFYVDAEAKYFVLPTPIVDKVYESIIGMIDSLPHCDMNKFSVHFKRTNGRAWDDMTEVRTMSLDNKEAMEAAKKRPFRITLELEVTHIIPSLGEE